MVPLTDGKLGASGVGTLEGSSLFPDEFLKKLEKDSRVPWGYDLKIPYPSSIVLRSYATSEMPGRLVIKGPVQ